MGDFSIPPEAMTLEQYRKLDEAGKITHPVSWVPGRTRSLAERQDRRSGLRNIRQGAKEILGVFDGPDPGR